MDGVSTGQPGSETGQGAAPDPVRAAGGDERPTAAHFVVRGAVQRVGFRRFVQRTAGPLGVHGWVRNRRDGSVEVRVMGTREAITVLRHACATGPAGARVAGIDDIDPGVAGPPARAAAPTSTFTILPDA
jgi:acylphosphatase